MRRRKVMHVPKLIDLTGQRFGRLTVVKRGENKGRITAWECVCECGNTVCVAGTSLTRGQTKSCGCYRIDNCREHPNGVKHGGRKTRLYVIWSDMKQRCFYDKSINYQNYGGRGITVCDKWLHDFKAFHDWAVSNGYDDSLTLDRINANGNYCPENCRWATRAQQDNNTTVNHRVTYNGETHTIAEWAEITGINYHKLWRRICVLKWDIEKALSTPV